MDTKLTQNLEETQKIIEMYWKLDKEIKKYLTPEQYKMMTAMVFLNLFQAHRSYTDLDLAEVRKILKKYENLGDLK